MNKNITIGIIGITFLLITAAVLKNQINKTQTIESKADSISLFAPYIRLSANSSNYLPGSTVAIDIYINTAGIESEESRFVIDFDSSILSLKETDIVNHNVFPVINIEQIRSGRAIFSLFTNKEAGFPTISLSREKKVATLNFHAIKRGSSTIDLVVNNGDESSSISEVKVSPEAPALNILNQAQNTSVNIE